MSDGILLDTVTFIDYLQGSLPDSIRQMVEKADRRYLSVVTPWEIQLKKVLRERTRPVDLTQAIQNMGLEIRTVLLEHIWFLRQLPEVAEHLDPFDRLLIAQACLQDLTLITRDRRFVLYPRLLLVTY